MPIKHLAGARHGKLVAIRPVGKSGKNILWECRCDCGGTKILKASYFGINISCGCATRPKETYTTTHGESKRGERTPEYAAWISMKIRCYLTGSTAYQNYGGRGISVCDRWLNSFENFLADMGRRPTAKHSLDRIDTNGNYDPANCRWADKKTQSVNRRGIRRLVYKGQPYVAADLARKLGVGQSTVSRWAKVVGDGGSVDDFVH